MIRVHLRDGRILNFPDGTDPAVVKAAAQRMMAQGRQEQGQNRSGTGPGTGGSLSPLAESAADSFMANTFPRMEEKREQLREIARRGDIGDRPFHEQPALPGPIPSHETSPLVAERRNALAEIGDRRLLGDQPPFVEPEPAPELMPAHAPSPVAVKLGQLDEIREEGDLGTEDFTDVAEPGWFPDPAKQGISQRSLRETVLDRGFGWAIGGAERAGLLPEGTRGAVRENQEEAFDRYLTAHPENALGIPGWPGEHLRAGYLALGDVAASAAGPQALLGPGAGALASRGAASLGAGPGLRALAGIAGGAAEGAGQAALDVIDLPPEERSRMVLLGAGMGGFSAIRGLGNEAAAGAGAVRGLADRLEGRGNAPPPPPKEVRAAVLETFAEAKAAAVAELPPEAHPAALAGVEARWQPALAAGGAAGDPVLGGMADQLQARNAPEIKAPPPLPEGERLAARHEYFTGQRISPEEALARRAAVRDPAALRRRAVAPGTHGEPLPPPPPGLAPGDPWIVSPERAALLRGGGYEGPLHVRQTGDASPAIDPEAGFIRLGRNKPPAPPPDPAETVMPRNEPTPPPLGPLGALQAAADKVTDQFLNREDALPRRLRRAGHKAEADFIEQLQGRARGAGGMIDPQRKAGPVFEGTYVYDPNLYGPGKFGSRRTGDGLEAVVGGLDDNALWDMDKLAAARRHLQLADRQAQAQLQYDWARARRLEELRQSRRADKASLRGMAGDVRSTQAQALQAARREARAAGEYRSFLTSEERLRRATPLRQHLAPAELSSDLAARRLGASAAPAARARGDALAAIRSGQRVAMGIRDAATRRVPTVERPADIDLDIDPRGTAVAHEILADLETRYGVEPDPATGAPRIRQLEEQVARFRDWTVRAWMIPLKEAGRFSDQEFRYWQNPDGSYGYAGDILAKNDLYAPFQRLMEVLGDEADVYGLSPVSSGKPNPIHAVTGGLSPDRPIARPVMSSVEIAQKAILWTERQRVRNVVADAVDSSPELQAEIRQLSPTGGIQGVGPKTGLPIHVRGSFPAWRNGVRTDYTAPPDVLRAVESMTPGQTYFVVEAAKLAARTLRAGATITLEFPFRNLGRDVQDAAVYGPGYNPVYKVLVDPVAGLLDVLGLGGGRWSKEMRANGGFLSGAVDSLRPQIEATIRDVTGQRGKVRARYESEIGGRFTERVTGGVGSAATTLLKTAFFPILAPMETLASGLESTAKVGAYRRMRLRGAGAGEAAVAARSVASPDFGQAGSFVRKWNGIEAFVNAEFQDLNRFGRAMRRNPGTTTIKALAYLTLPAIANWYKNKDDEEYQRLPDWERIAFYHPAKLDNGRWVRIPRPLGMLNIAFSYGPQKLLERMAGEDPDAIEELGKAFVASTPLHFSPQLDTFSQGGHMDALPSIAQPLVEVAAGPAGYSSHREGPIDTTAVYPGSAPLPEDRVRDQTSGIARAAGKAFGVSPIKVDYLLQGYGAYWGRTLAQATGPLARAAGADPAASDTLMGRMAQGGSPQLPTTASDIPGVRGFISSPAIGFGSDPVTKLYQLANSVRESVRSKGLAVERKDLARYHAVLREHPEFRLDDNLKDDLKYLAELRKKRSEILDQPGLDPTVRLDLILSIDQRAAAFAGQRMHRYSDLLHNEE
jgi:hypothetical protein